MEEILKFLVVFNFEIDFSDYIEIGGVLVNFFLAIWIVKTIQNKLTNKRILKDHYISEVKELKLEYDLYIKNCYSGTLIPKDTLRWFKLINLRKNHLMDDILELYKIECRDLDEFHNDLRDVITNSTEYSLNYRLDTAVTLSSSTKRKIDVIQLRKLYYSLFNKLVRLVNDAD